MSIVTELKYTANLDKGVCMTPITPSFMGGDQEAHRFVIDCYRQNSREAVDLSGAGVTAYFVRADGMTIPLNGETEGNKASVLLPAACYAVMGRFSLVIKLSLDDGTADSISTVFWGEGAVSRSRTDVVIDPDSVIPSLEELLAQIAAMEIATENANTAASNANQAAADALKNVDEAVARQDETISQLSEEVAEKLGGEVFRGMKTRIEPDYESGTIGATTGEPLNNVNVVRTAEFLSADKPIYVFNLGAYKIGVGKYDTNGVFIGYYETLLNIRLADGYKYKLIFKSNSGGAVEFDENNVFITTEKINAKMLNGVRDIAGINLEEDAVTALECSFFETGKNLLNFSSFFLSSAINSNGEVVQAENMCVSDFIVVTPENTYTIGGAHSVGFYDINKNFITADNGENLNKRLAENHVCYIRVVLSAQTPSTDKHYLRVDGISAPTPYFTEIKEAVMPLNAVSEFTAKSVVKIAWELGALATSSGATVNNNNKCRTVGFVSAFKPLTIYNPNGKYRFQVFKYDIHGNYINNKSDYIQDKVRLSAGFKYKIVAACDGVSGGINFIDFLPRELFLVQDYIADSAESNRYFAKIPNKVYSHYVPTITPKSYSSRTEINFDEVYGIYDALVSAYPDFIAKETLGNDASGQYPVYQYTFSPKTAKRKGEDIELPKIVIFAGTHGVEKTSIVTLALAMKEIYTNWQSNELLEFLRHNIKFVIVPISNPHGFAYNDFSGARQNGNGVDINRNFDWRWESYAGNDETYKGTAPFSEVETQYMRDILLKNSDCLCAIDFHSNMSSVDGYAKTFYFLVSDIAKTRSWETVSASIFTKMGIRAQKDYDCPETNEILGFVDSTLEPHFVNYFQSVGVEATIIECPYKPHWSASGALSTQNFKMCVEYFLNTLAYIINVFA